jgi:hypothetical protein
MRFYSLFDVIDVNDMAVQCRLCRFWFTNIERPDHDPQEAHRVGHCRINPPTCARDFEGASFHDTWDEGIWPQTGFSDSCGQFSPRALSKLTPDPLLAERSELEVKTQSD